MNIKTFLPSDLSQAELHAYLLTAVAPRPICFASTVNNAGQVNLSPFSFFNVFSSNPPILIFSPARRGRDNTTKHTLQNVQEVPEVVINVVNFAIVEQMSLSSSDYDKGVNEFEKAGLTAVPSAHIKPPRVQESPVSFECKVNEVKPLGTGPGAGNLVIAEVIAMHLDEQFLDANQKLDSTKLDLVARMGGSWYSRATPASLFEIPKPLRTLGIGIDALPLAVQNSRILSGNNLGRLGNQAKLPTEEDYKTMKSDPLFQPFFDALDTDSSDSTTEEKIHLLAKKLIEQDKPFEGLKMLTFDATKYN